MLISVNLTSSTAEASDSVLQTVTVFGDVLSQLGGSISGFSQIEQLAFCLTVAHPISSGRSSLSSGSYDVSARCFYANASLNYSAWVKPDWVARVQAVALALTAATAAIHKTRITETERAQILALLAEAELQTASNSPKQMVDLQPIELTFFPGQTEPMVAFGRSLYKPAGSERTIILQPEGISEFLSSRAAAPSELRPEMFKRYRRSSGTTEYREAWPSDDSVVEHWGVCGERGQTREHPAPTATDQINVLKQLKSKAAALGFKPIPASRHAQLLVQRPVTGMGTVQDLDERHALEAFLNEWMGWRGLGHCDGGSIGSGTMEAVCFVVDARVASVALVGELERSRFSAFSVIN